MEKLGWTFLVHHFVVSQQIKTLLRRLFLVVEKLDWSLMIGRNSFMNFLLTITSLRLAINTRNNMKIWPVKIIVVFRFFPKLNTFFAHIQRVQIRPNFVTRRNIHFQRKVFTMVFRRIFLQVIFVNITRHSLFLLFLMLLYWF